MSPLGNGPASNVRHRPAEVSDIAFLATMLGESAVWRPDKPSPTGDQVMADPRYAKYLAGWPKPGDHGIVAQEEGVPLGAAWYRTFDESSHGFGFVSGDVPELAIAVVESRRREGIGRRLLVNLIRASIAEGRPGLSLAVNHSNPARRLYESLGFGVVGEIRPTASTMIRYATHST